MTTMKQRSLALLLGGTLLLSVPAFAQDGSGAGAYNADALSAEGFVAVEGGGDANTIPGGSLMLAAYLIFLGLVGAYGVQLARRHATVQGELANLRRLMEDIDDRIDGLEREKRG